MHKNTHNFCQTFVILEKPKKKSFRILFLCDRMNVQLTTSAEKKTIIFESTLKLVKEYGFHGTPISQIAQEAGVATGTIYHYFTSKEALITELFGYCRAQITEAIFKPDEMNLPYAARFVSIWINFVNYYIRFPEVLSFLEQFSSSPYIKAVYCDSRICFQDEISNFLYSGVTSGHLKPLDINIISAAFLGTVAATAKKHNNGPFQFNEDDMKKTVAIIWDGIKIS